MLGRTTGAYPQFEIENRQPNQDSQHSRRIIEKDDRLPYRLLQEPLPEGPCKRQVEEILTGHYELLGWNTEGKRSREKLTELGWIFSPRISRSLVKPERGKPVQVKVTLFLCR